MLSLWWLGLFFWFWYTWYVLWCTGRTVFHGRVWRHWRGSYGNSKVLWFIRDSIICVWPIPCNFLQKQKMALVKCQGAGQRRRVFQNAGPVINVRHFLCTCPHKWLLWHVCVRVPFHSMPQSRCGSMGVCHCSLVLFPLIRALCGCY